MRKLLMILGMLLRPSGRGLVPAANIAEGTVDDGIKSLQADAAITETHGLVKIGTDVNHFAQCGNDEVPDGIVQSTVSAQNITDELRVAVKMLGACKGTVLMRASEAIDPTSVDYVCSAASGRVKGLPATAGTYYIVGKPLTTAAAAGDLIEVAPCVPTQRVVSG